MTPIKFKFSKADGEPIAGAEFTISLRRADFDETGEKGITLPEVIVLTTDSQGEATVSLMPLLQPYYLEMQHTTPSFDDCSALARFRFVVPDSALPIKVEDLIVTDPTWSRPWDETAIAFIVENRTASEAAANASEASAVRAEAAAVRTDDAEQYAIRAEAGATQSITARDASEAYAIQAAASASQTASDRIATKLSEVNSAASEGTASAASATATAAQATATASAAAALASEQAAATSASGAAASAGTTTTDATTATTAAGTATTAAGTATAAATAAGASETKAKAWADTAEDVPVEPGKFSALHWALKAAASAADSSVLAFKTLLKAADGLKEIGYKFGTAYDRLAGTPSLRDYGNTVVNGTASNQDMVVAAAAANQGGECWVPAGTYVLTDNVPGFHGVMWTGPGVFKRGNDTFRVRQRGGQLNRLYMSPTGTAGNDGLTAALPLPGIQAAVDALAPRNRLEGRWQLMGAGGVYRETVLIPDGLAQDANYLEFKFPADPGMQGDPMAWPEGGAILDCAGLAAGYGFAIGAYNKVYVEYLLTRNVFDGAVAENQQVRRGMTVDKNSFLLGQGLSFSGNGICNLSVLPGGSAQMTGGILDGARFGIDNTGGRLSLTSTAANFTTIRKALEYGLYQKHESSTVMDFTLFEDNGLHPLASTYGAAIFCYKSNASIDTRECKFNRNNIVYNLRGGVLSSHPTLVDVFGTGANANGRIWMRKCNGMDDLLGYQAYSPLELSKANTGTTTSASTAIIVGDICTLPPGYFVTPDQKLEIEIHGVSNSGTANILPTFTQAGVGNFGAGNFVVAANTRFVIRITIFPLTGATQTLMYDNTGATVLSATIGRTNLGTPFDTNRLTFQVRGYTTAGSIEIYKASVKLWG